jgi:PHP family Zn ribbon phosphoesterase
VKFKADLHIHSVLSPCGDLEMSPSAIIKEAKSKGLNIIGISDHNSTRNALVTKKIAEKNNIFVLCGAEVTTKEEVHCLCFMPDENSLLEFQKFLDSKYVFFQNDPNKFGYQLVVDEDENIIDEVDTLLINAIDYSIEDLQKKVYELNGIFIPAHVDRPRFSLSSQLVFIPDNLKYDALELSKYAEQTGFLQNFPWFSPNRFIMSSDAHFIPDIGSVYTELEMKSLSFEGVRLALQNLKIR